MASLLLPTPSRRLETYRTAAPSTFATTAARPFNRRAFAAVHVVADSLSAREPWVEPAVDWEQTLSYRRYLWGLGFAVAEAMDTAQRGMGLDWAASLELIRRSVAAAADVPGAVVFSGAGTDQLPPQSGLGLDAVIRAYEEQCSAIESCNGRIILMASRALAAAARGPEDYAHVYGRILAQVRDPVIVHWLGDMFDPALAGYWGHRDVETAMDVCLEILRTNAAKIDGVKISLLDRRAEIMMRRRLPKPLRMYTGDDFHFAELIAGDEHGSSDALLGIFDAIAPAAAAALAALAAGNRERYDRILAPTVPLSRHIFAAPTRFYKTGIVFMAWLNRHQEHFIMIGGAQSARHIVHLAELFRLADRAGLLCDPELAADRMKSLLLVHGIGT
jgi:Protein of unknown function (DUF993)